MLPFDWKTPFGYCVAWFSQTVACTAIIVADIPFFTLIFASSWLFIIITGDLKQELAIFNNEVKTFDGCNGYVDLMRRFCGIAQCYTDAKG